ncbi:MAG: glycosyltransferase family 2 protein [Rikenellaceae bacterium]
MTLSIITINYNGASSTISTVESIRSVLKNFAFEYEIVVIDNNSLQSDFDLLKSLSNVRLIRNSENVGFAAANNIGFRESTGQYIMMINSDATVKDDIFTPLIQFLEQNPIIGAVSPKIVYDREPYVIQFGGYRLCDRFLFDIQSPLHGRLASEVEDICAKSSFAHGAAMMIRRELLFAVGSMREDYFLYFEEIDFSLKILKSGYQIWYYPHSVVYHNASFSTGGVTGLKIYYNSRNRLYLAKNNLRGFDRLVALTMQLGFSFPKSVVKLLLKRKFSESWAYCRGVQDFILNRRGKSIHNS